MSPGSLYQYFGSKDEIVAAVIDRVAEGFAESISPALRQAAGEPPHDATRTVLESVLTHLEPRAALLDSFVDRVPAEAYEQALGQLRARISDVIYHLLAAQRDQLRHGDLERMTWMAVQMTQHLVVRYILDRPRITRDDFLDDLSGLLLGLAMRG